MNYWCYYWYPCHCRSSLTDTPPMIAAVGPSSQYLDLHTSNLMSCQWFCWLDHHSLLVAASAQVSVAPRSTASAALPTVSSPSLLVVLLSILSLHSNHTVNTTSNTIMMMMMVVMILIIMRMLMMRMSMIMMTMIMIMMMRTMSTTMMKMVMTTMMIIDHILHVYYIDSL